VNLVKRRWFAAVYMFVVTSVCSSVVIGLSRVTAERVQANAALAFERAVLGVLPGLYEDGLGGLEIHRRFVDRVDGPTQASGGAYVLAEGGAVAAYALPFEGQGFWAPIRGVIGIRADRRTITGIAFYDQNETPGLGARITEPEFRNPFEGRVLAEQGKLLEFRRPGEMLSANEVHAVTGATQTSTRLEKIINDALIQWRGRTSGRAGS